MLIRIRRPHQPPADRDLGPAVARVHDYVRQGRTIDDDRGLPAPWMRGLRPGGQHTESHR